MKKTKLIFIILTFIVSFSSTMNVFASGKSDSGSRAVPFIIGTDIGPQVFAVSHYYSYSETYTPGINYIRYTLHQSSSWLEGWTGSAFGNVVSYNCHSANYYDSYGNYIKSASMTRDTDMIWTPNQDQYESATGTDIATVNTSKSTAKARFMVACYDSLYAPSTVDLELLCK